jgi:hypothetical protein
VKEDAAGSLLVVADYRHRNHEPSDDHVKQEQYGEYFPPIFSHYCNEILGANLHDYRRTAKQFDDFDEPANPPFSIEQSASRSDFC